MQESGQANGLPHPTLIDTTIWFRSNVAFPVYNTLYKHEHERAYTFTVPVMSLLLTESPEIVYTLT